MGTGRGTVIKRALSAVLTLAAAGLRSKVKVMVGGGPVTNQVCAYVGADALGADAQAAVTLCDKWIK